MEIILKSGKPCFHTFEGEPVNFCIPAVDVLFTSAAKIYKNRVLGVLLTGMGADGVNGLDMIRKYGGKTIAESKETCVLYGMPKIAAERGVADLIVPNYEVKNHMIKHANL
jgi:two-component system chemotaxis response regulator CheB